MIIGPGTTIKAKYVGQGSGSVLFNPASSQYLSVPSNTGFDQTGAFTIECWAYPTAASDYNYIWGENSSGFLCVRFLNNHWQIDQAGVGNPPGYTTLNTTYANNTWYHIALIWTGVAGSLAVNGNVEATFTGAGGASGNLLTIGNYTGVSPAYFAGNISNFRVVKGTAVYSTGTFTPPSLPLTAITGTQLLLSTLYGPTFLQDNSINNFTVTDNNSATSAVLNPFGLVGTGTAPSGPPFVFSTTKV